MSHLSLGVSPARLTPPSLPSQPAVRFGGEAEDDWRNPLQAQPEEKTFYNQDGTEPPPSSRAFKYLKYAVVGFLGAFGLTQAVHVVPKNTVVVQDSHWDGVPDKTLGKGLNPVMPFSSRFYSFSTASQSNTGNFTLLLPQGKRLDATLEYTWRLDPDKAEAVKAALNLDPQKSYSETELMSLVDTNIVHEGIKLFLLLDPIQLGSLRPLEGAAILNLSDVTPLKEKFGITFESFQLSPDSKEALNALVPPPELQTGPIRTKMQTIVDELKAKYSPEDLKNNPEVQKKFAGELLQAMKDAGIPTGDLAEKPQSVQERVHALVQDVLKGFDAQAVQKDPEVRRRFEVALQQRLKAEGLSVGKIEISAPD